MCKKCGTVYLCDSSYGTRNPRPHIINCARRDTLNVGQLMLM